MNSIKNLNRRIIQSSTTIGWSVIAFITIFTLSSVLLVISFNRPIGDDYSFYNLYHNNEWLGQLTSTLETMNGRYAQNVSAAIFYKTLGMNSTYTLPTLALLGFLSIMILSIYKFITPLKNPRQLLGALAIALAYMSMIYLAPGTAGLSVLNTFQNLLWAPGIITYTIPFLLLTVAILLVHSLLVRNKNSSALAFYIFAVYVTGLFNELQPTTVMTVSMVGLITLTMVRKSTTRPRLFFYLTSSLIASASALLTIYLSGANQARRAITHSMPIDQHFLFTVCNKFISTVSDFFKIEYIVLLVVAGLAIYAIIRNITPKKILHLRAQLISIGFLVVFLISLSVTSVLVTMGYGETSPLLNRTLLLPQIAFITSLLFLGISLGRSLQYGFLSKYQKVSLAVVSGSTTLLLLTLPSHIQDIRRQVMLSSSYMSAWIDQDLTLKKTAVQQTEGVTYLSKPASGIGDGYSLTCTGAHVDDTNWLNIDIQKYYGVNKICASEK